MAAVTPTNQVPANQPPVADQVPANQPPVANQPPAATPAPVERTPTEIMTDRLFKSDVTRPAVTGEWNKIWGKDWTLRTVVAIFLPVVGWAYGVISYAMSTKPTEEEVATATTAEAAADAEDKSIKKLNDAIVLLVHTVAQRNLFESQTETYAETQIAADKAEKKFSKALKERMEKKGIALGTAEHKMAVEIALQEANRKAMSHNKSHVMQQKMQTFATAFGCKMSQEYAASLVAAYATADAVTPASFQANVASLQAFLPAGTPVSQVQAALRQELLEKFKEGEFLELSNAQMRPIPEAPVASAAPVVPAPGAPSQADITAMQTARRATLAAEFQALETEMAALRGPNFNNGTISTAEQAVTALTAASASADAQFLNAVHATGFLTTVTDAALLINLMFNVAPYNTNAALGATLVAAQAEAVRARAALEQATQTRDGLIARLMEIAGGFDVSQNPTGGLRGTAQAAMNDDTAITTWATQAAQDALTTAHTAALEQATANWNAANAAAQAAWVVERDAAVAAQQTVTTNNAFYAELNSAVEPETVVDRFLAMRRLLPTAAPVVATPVEAPVVATT